MKPLLHPIIAIVLVSLCIVSRSSAQPAPAHTWYKGNLHTHSLWSDGDDFPERIALWYRDHGYDFLTISDHNNVQAGDKWVKYVDLRKRGAGPATDKYLADFADTAKTRGSREAGNQEIRLVPFSEYHPRLQQPGKFLLIPGEEISDKFEQKPIHVGAINIAETIKPQGGNSVAEVIANDFRAIREQGKRLGRPVLPHLNHPNFKWGVTAQEMAQVLDEQFFEVYNGHPEVRVQGDEEHPSTEKMWDIANTLRIVSLKVPPLMGLATDDSHHYHVTGMARSTSGRGWICVRAKTLSTEALIASMEAGDFYASSGITLTDIKYDPVAGTLEVAIAPEAGARITTCFVGSLRGENGKPGDVGVVLATVEGHKATYRLTGRELYVRAIINSDQPPANPSYKDQKKQAWTQPVGWERHLPRR